MATEQQKQSVQTEIDLGKKISSRSIPSEEVEEIRYPELRFCVQGEEHEELFAQLPSRGRIQIEYALDQVSVLRRQGEVEVAVTLDVKKLVLPATPIEDDPEDKESSTEEVLDALAREVAEKFNSAD